MGGAEQDCEVCGAPGEPSWGGVVLCENCYGTAGAVCSGVRLAVPNRGKRPPVTDLPDVGENPGVC